MNKSMDRLLRKILSLPLWQGTTSEALIRVQQIVADRQRPIHIVTLNAEIALFAAQHEQVARVICDADFLIADSAAIELASRYLVRRPATRITGIDFAERLISRRGDGTAPRVALVGCRSSATRDRAAAFVAGRGGVVVYASEGPSQLDFEHAHVSPWLDELSGVRPDVILLAFHYGYQEWWGSRLAHALSVPCVIIGVGGTFDVWGGALARAPRWMRRLRIEWLWRVVQQPRRLCRIVRATIFFPLQAARAFLL